MGTKASQGLGEARGLRAAAPSCSSLWGSSSTTADQHPNVSLGEGWAWAGAKGEDPESPLLKPLWSRHCARRYGRDFSAPHSLSASPPCTVLPPCGLGWPTSFFIFSLSLFQAGW